jgi:anti-sigma B factor antagonist
MDFTVTEISDFMVIKPVGRIDWESARLLDKEVQRLVGDGHVHIVFNLDDVSFICSAGIGALVYHRNKLEQLGGAAYIIADNEYITYIFEALNFKLIFEGYMYKTFDEFSAAVLDGGGKKAEEIKEAKEA